MKVSKRFSFEAAHSLPHLPEGHKCRNVHGHSYGVELEYDGPLLPEFGWVIDYGDIKAAWLPCFSILDHGNIDRILPMSTAENLAIWIWDRCKLRGLSLAVRVFETASTSVTYNGKP